MQAEELDDLVQRLTAAKYALSARDERTATEAVDAALAAARRLLTAHRGESLTRTRSAD